MYMKRKVIKYFSVINLFIFTLLFKINSVFADVVGGIDVLNRKRENYIEFLKKLLPLFILLLVVVIISIILGKKVENNSSDDIIDVSENKELENMNENIENNEFENVDKHNEM